MKTWLLIDHDGEPRDRWESREMPIEEAFLRAGRLGPKFKVWIRREVLEGVFEAAIGTMEEVLEIWPSGAVVARKPAQEEAS